MMNTLELIDQMHPQRHPDLGMDVVIIVTSNPHQAEEWQKRLDESKGSIIKSTALALAVCEDWPAGGAGNGLGTLYAYQQARLKAQNHFSISLDELLGAGASAAIYHTAGMGMRLFPLAATEHNNKAAVRLPDGKGTITLLEAVIRQTAIYAPGRKGRLSVFWGDQLFIPSELPPTQSHAHVDILSRLISIPSQEEWQSQDLSRYGLIANAGQKNPQLLEKVTYDALETLIASGKVHRDTQLGVSLGSFSLSMMMLQALLEEFRDDLQARRGKWDTDPHFWMPLTLSYETYLAHIKADTAALPILDQHYDRMQRFKQRFMKADRAATPLFQAIDVGSMGYWWDYGSVDAYFHNLSKLTGQNAESHAMRSFFNLKIRRQSNRMNTVDGDNCSIICGSAIHEGTIRNSVVIGVIAHNVDLHDCVVIDSIAPAITAKESLLYNVIEPQPIAPPPRTIRADTFVTEGSQQFKMVTTLGRNGKTDWRERLGDNPLSYAQLWQINQKTDFHKAQNMAAEARQRLEIEVTNRKKENRHDNNYIKKAAD